MRQTLEELVDIEKGFYLPANEVLQLLKQVRKATLIEAMNCCKKYLSYSEVYDEICELDENSIEIQEQNGKEKSI